MAQNENTLWDILSLMHGRKQGWSTTLAGKEPNHHEVDHGFAVGRLKGQLVLKYRPEDIEDTIYFMKHRGYLLIHGQGMIAPEMVYSLSDKAVAAFESKSLPEEEEQAFQEALWDIKPKLYGVGPNLSEWKKRWRKRKERKS